MCWRRGRCHLESLSSAHLAAQFIFWRNRRGYQDGVSLVGIITSIIPVARFPRIWMRDHLPPSTNLSVLVQIGRSNDLGIVSFSSQFHLATNQLNYRSRLIPLIKEASSIEDSCLISV